MRVKGVDGREFVVRVVWKGDRYGQDGCLTNHDKPIVEFYDATYEETAAFGPLGQFVGSYYIETLLDRASGVPLNLWTSVPEWTIPASEVSRAMEWVVEEAERRAEEQGTTAPMVMVGDS